jgi:hypothetical protein
MFEALTSSASRAAMRSMGIRKARKNMVRMANPLAARVCTKSSQQVKCRRERARAAYDNAVVPGENGKLIQSGDEIPACGDVARKEYAKGED